MPYDDYRGTLIHAMGDDPADAVSQAIEAIVARAVGMLEAKDAEIAGARLGDRLQARTLPDTLNREVLANFFGEIRLPNGAVATGHFVETALGLLHQIRPPRYEVRPGNLGDWEIWDTRDNRRIATYNSRDEFYANDWARYLNEKEARGE